MNYVITFILILSINIFISNAAKAEKCDDEEVVCYCGTSNSDKNSKGSTSKNMCFTFNGDNSTQLNFFFKTEVDEFTLVTLEGMDLNNNSIWADDTTIQLEIGGYISEERKIVPDNFAVEQLTAIIWLDDGNVDDITWDDGCYGCGDDCVNTAVKENKKQKNCAQNMNNCGAKDPNTCYLSVYISWFGTDKSGEYLTSSGQRLSQFQSLSASSYYDSVSDEVGNQEFDNPVDDGN